MIDGGDRNASQFIYSYLKSIDVKRLDYIIATHPHDDHIEGLAAALVACDAGILYSPILGMESEIFQELTRKAKDKNVMIKVPKRGETFTVGDAIITFLSNVHPDWDLNNQSIVIRMDYGSTSFLFTGDAAWEEEQDLLEMNIKADVLKVGHHGAATSTSQEFLDAVHPTFAVISVGADNKYGHPAQETLGKLQRLDVAVFRTDRQGTIICTSDGENLNFVTTKKNRKW